MDFKHYNMPWQNYQEKQNKTNYNELRFKNFFKSLKSKLKSLWEKLKSIFIKKNDKLEKIEQKAKTVDKNEKVTNPNLDKLETETVKQKKK